MKSLSAACLLLSVVLVLATVVVSAAEAPPGAGGEEPEITIIQRDDAIIEEYRVGGQLYMIKVTPRKGIPYYLVDTDGDGRLDSRRSELAEDMMIPRWTLFRW